MALIVSALILANGGVNAQRGMTPIEEPAPAPALEESGTTAVMVENFPATQTVDVRNFPLTVTVEGTVDVGNFPATQNVGGTVDIGNLPLDENGHLLVASQRSTTALVLHSTTATYQGDLGGRAGATAKCRAEFRSSHFATISEVTAAWGLRGIVWLTSETEWSWIDDLNGTRNCSEWQAITNDDGSRRDGNLIRAKGTDIGNPGPCSDFNPILCAE